MGWMRKFGTTVLCSAKSESFVIQRRFFRPIKLPRHIREKLEGKEDEEFSSGAHLDELDPYATGQALKGLRADLDHSIRPQKPPSATECQLKFNAIRVSYVPALYAFRTIDVVDFVDIVNRHGLVPIQNAHDVLSQWLGTEHRNPKEITLLNQIGEERYKIVRSLLIEWQWNLDKNLLTPVTRRVQALGLDADLWVPFLRSALTTSLSDRFHRKQLADVLLGIREGMTPEATPLPGQTNNDRTAVLARLLLSASREVGDVAFGMFCVDLLNASGTPITYEIQKELMYVNHSSKKRGMDQALRSSGEMRSFVPYFLRMYLPRADMDKRANVKLTSMSTKGEIEEHEEEDMEDVDDSGSSSMAQSSAQHLGDDSSLEDAPYVSNPIFDDSSQVNDDIVVDPDHITHYFRSSVTHVTYKTSEAHKLLLRGKKNEISQDENSQTYTLHKSHFCSKTALKLHNVSANRVTVDTLKPRTQKDDEEVSEVAKNANVTTNKKWMRKKRLAVRRRVSRKFRNKTKHALSKNKMNKSRKKKNKKRA